MSRLFKLMKLFKLHRLNISEELLSGLRAYIEANREKEADKITPGRSSQATVTEKPEEKEPAAKTGKRRAPEINEELTESRCTVEYQRFYQTSPPERKKSAVKRPQEPEKAEALTASSALKDSKESCRKKPPLRKDISRYFESDEDVAAPINIGELPQNGEIIGEMISKNRCPSFAQRLMLHIEAAREKESVIYRRAQIDRRVFSKIRSNRGYHPSRDTVLALAMALRLNRGDTNELLESAGYALSRSITGDLIIAFCIERELFDLDDVNTLLEYFGERVLMG